MIGIICLIVVICIICIICSSTKRLKTTGNKRIVELTTESGKKTYRCEEEFDDGTWKTMMRMISVGPYCEDTSYIEAIFKSKDDALKFIGQHPDQIIKSKKVI